MMEKTLVLLKPSCVQRQLIGEIVNRFERRGLRVAGMKMMQLSDEICPPRRPSILPRLGSVDADFARRGTRP